MVHGLVMLGVVVSGPVVSGSGRTNFVRNSSFMFVLVFFFFGVGHPPFMGGNDLGICMYVCISYFLISRYWIGSFQNIYTMILLL